MDDLGLDLWQPAPSGINLDRQECLELLELLAEKLPQTSGMRKAALQDLYIRIEDYMKRRT